MSTQYANDIPFTSAHHQQAFKLLELPPELLTLLESENPPTLTITNNASTGTAHLIHPINPAMKYQLRQKNTSNPLMILSPSRTKAGDGDDAETFIERPSILAIAKIEDTIELILIEEKEGEKKEAKKVNKWHEKFAKGRSEAGKK